MGAVEIVVDDCNALMVRKVVYGVELCDVVVVAVAVGERQSEIRKHQTLERRF